MPHDDNLEFKKKNGKELEMKWSGKMNTNVFDILLYALHMNH